MIKYQMYRVLNKLAKITDISVIYETRAGIKSLNQLMKSREQGGREFYCAPEELFMGFDALKDKYSLVGVCVTESPHRTLMEALDGGEDIRKTEYCIRQKKGTLDSRSSAAVKKSTVKGFKDKFCRRREEVLADSYAPVQVYRLGEKYFIADGKHRAAMCAHLGKKVKCVEISSDFLLDSFRMWMYGKMKKKPKDYSRNISMFEKLNVGV